MWTIVAFVYPPSRGTRRARRELNIVYASDGSKGSVVQVLTGVNFSNKFLLKVIAISHELQTASVPRSSNDTNRRWNYW